MGLRGFDMHWVILACEEKPDWPSISRGFPSAVLQACQQFSILKIHPAGLH